MYGPDRRVVNRSRSYFRRRVYPSPARERAPVAHGAGIPGRSREEGHVGDLVVHHRCPVRDWRGASRRRLADGVRVFAGLCSSRLALVARGQQDDEHACQRRLAVYHPVRSHRSRRVLRGCPLFYGWVRSHLTLHPPL